jgi:hypothetical protein
MCLSACWLILKQEAVSVAEVKIVKRSSLQRRFASEKREEIFNTCCYLNSTEALQCVVLFTDTLLGKCLFNLNVLSFTGVKRRILR